MFVGREEEASSFCDRICDRSFRDSAISACRSAHDAPNILRGYGLALNGEEVSPAPLLLLVFLVVDFVVDLVYME